MSAILVNANTQAGRIESFVNFVMERERIRERKMAGEPRPWTKDPILQAYHFCNVRRRDDRVTEWIGRWSRHFKKEDWWLMFAVARWFNAPDTLDRMTPILQQGWSKATEAKLVKLCDTIKAEGRSVFRGSYIINNSYNTTVSKWEAVITGPLRALAQHPPRINRRSIQECHATVKGYLGHGDFMAGQIVADWQTFGVIYGADVLTWAPIGPGSNRGLKYIYADRYIRRYYTAHMIELLDAIEARDEKLAATFTLHDVQNCLCEFSKYVRGYSKTKYQPYNEKQGILL